MDTGSVGWFLVMIPTVSEDELADLYAWVDSIPLSKPKKSIARDFSDGVCVADVVHCYFPKLVELHNYRCVVFVGVVRLLSCLGIDRRLLFLKILSMYPVLNILSQSCL